MKIFSSKKRVAAIGVVTAATLVGGGVAFAYWTTTGEGGGTASTGTSDVFEVNFDDPTLPEPTLMTPGGPSQLHHVSVVNLNTGAQRVQSVVVRVGTSASDTWSVSNPNGTCGAADFEVESATGIWGSSADVLLTDTTLATPGAFVELPVNVRMKETGVAQDGCKSLTNAVPLFASVS